jgi:hypothetical protein
MLSSKNVDSQMAEEKTLILAKLHSFQLKVKARYEKNIF